MFEGSHEKARVRPSPLPTQPSETGYLPVASRMKLSIKCPSLWSGFFPDRPRVSRGLDACTQMSRLKHYGYCAVGIIVGLSLAGVAYHIVSLVGIAISGAETVQELHVGWFPIRVLVALRVASLSGARVYGLCSRK